MEGPQTGQPRDSGLLVPEGHSARLAWALYGLTDSGLQTSLGQDAVLLLVRMKSRGLGRPICAEMGIGLGAGTQEPPSATFWRKFFLNLLPDQDAELCMAVFPQL